MLFDAYAKVGQAVMLAPMRHKEFATTHLGSVHRPGLPGAG
ncbi:MAG: hypothetical protein WKG07_01185 [Hymenobacter sp.]